MTTSSERNSQRQISSTGSQWAHQYGSPADVLPFWTAAWHKANQIRSKEPVLWGSLDEICRSIAANYSRDNCIALLNDLVRISEADGEAQVAEANFCAHVSRLMGLSFRLEPQTRPRF